VNTGLLEVQFDAGTTITPALLAEFGIIRDAEKPVVVLGDGDLTKKLTVQAHRFSKSAQEKISGAGGATEVLPIKITGARATVKLLRKEDRAKLEGK
jgi:large subunit ribosomal protein L15